MPKYFAQNVYISTAQPSQSHQHQQQQQQQNNAHNTSATSSSCDTLIADNSDDESDHHFNNSNNSNKIITSSRGGGGYTTTGGHHNHHQINHQQQQQITQQQQPTTIMSLSNVKQETINMTYDFDPKIVTGKISSHLLDHGYGATPQNCFPRESKIIPKTSSDGACITNYYKVNSN